MSAPSFSAVVVLHDSKAALRRLLASLEEQLGDRGPELIVADSGSRDGGAELARRAGATVIDLPANPGFGPAVNAAVAHATAEVTVLLNPDIELVDDRLLGLVSLAHDRDALLAPRLVGAGGRVERSAHPRPGTAAALLPALVHPRALPRRARLRADPWRSESPTRVGWAIAACLCARTETLRRLGPFDPTAFLYGEDIDLCLNAAAQGLPVELHPEVVLRHEGGHSTVPALGQGRHELVARRRREVVARRLGRRALALDDLAQGVTFATRAGARVLLGRDASLERAQLRALRTARASSGAPRAS
jgi:GT2 family glycosyltransferase